MTKPEPPREIDQTGDGTRITLRPQGCARFAGAAFLLLWVGGWAVGEAFALNLLLAFAGIAYRVPFPIAIPPFPLAPASFLFLAFILLWLGFWTWGGLTAIAQVLQLLAGRDTIVLGHVGWSVERGLGPFAFRRELHGWVPELTRRDFRLIARRDRKTRRVSALGTPAERLWVHDEILRRYPVLRPKPLELPREYEARRESDGTIVIQRNARARRGAIGCGVVALLIGCLPLGMWIRYPGSKGSLVIFAAIALLFTAFALWCFLARQSWRVGRNVLEERLEFFRFARRWRFTSAALDIDYSRDSDGDEWFTLWVRDAGGRKRKLHSATNDPEETVAFARYLATHSGWPLQEPTELARLN